MKAKAAIAAKRQRAVKIKPAAARAAGKGLARAADAGAEGGGTVSVTSIARTVVRARSAWAAFIDDELKRRVLRASLPIMLFALIGAGLGVGAKAAWSWVATTPIFAIRELKLKCGPRVRASEVRRLANLQEGDNLIDFRLRRVVAQIEIHPWVKRATVTRELPDRVVIEVIEREPAAAIALGALYYVDADGDVFKRVLPGERMDYPVFSGVTLQEVVEDREKVVPLIKLGLAVTAAAANSSVLSAGEISEVRLDKNLGATIIRASDGLKIKIGRDNLPEKWERLEAALLELGEQTAKVAELDLNYQGRVTVRLREGYRVASSESGSPEGL